MVMKMMIVVIKVHNPMMMVMRQGKFSKHDLCGDKAHNGDWGCGRQVLSTDFGKWAEEGGIIAEEVRL